MGNLHFFLNLTVLTLRKFCQQRLLLAELALFCLFLPLLAGPAAEYVLSEGVSFSGLTIAVTGHADDPVPQLIEQYVGKMTDVRKYCTFLAMERRQALQALEDGEVTAVLELPEDFVQGIRQGDNPDVRLIVAEDRPLESLLTLWVGQSASDLLAAIQSGIYAVLDIYEQQPPAGLTWDQAMLDINLHYINRTLNRQDHFRIRELSATQSLPVTLHYGAAVLAYLTLSLAPLFSSLYTGQWLFAQRRWRCLGRGSLPGYLSALTGSALVILLFMTPALLLLSQASAPALLCAVLLWAAFCAVFGGFCCLITGNTAGCGTLVFFLSLSALFVSGGVLPPVLLPEFLRSLSWLSPVSWLHGLTSLLLGYETDPRCFWMMGLVTAGLFLLSAFLYHRRLSRQEVLL